MSDYTADTLGFWRDGYAALLDWTDVVGMGSAERINVQATAYSVGKSKMPDTIPVELQSKTLDNSLMAGVTARGATLAVPKRLELKRLDKPPADAPQTGQKRTYYRLELDAKELGFNRPTSIRTVATVVRRGGTSDAYFREALGFTSRGAAAQPSQVNERSGSQEKIEPDAAVLLKAGGVELLDVRFVPRPCGRI